jgi:hypothetical protein
VKAQPLATPMVLNLRYHCGCCAHDFAIKNPPPDNSLVKFVCDSGDEEAWIPVYTKGGYLDLVEHCVAEYSQDQEISMKVSKAFLDKFREIQRRPASGGYWVFPGAQHCPRCKEKNLTLVSERCAVDHALNWIEYDCNALL